MRILVAALSTLIAWNSIAFAQATSLSFGWDYSISGQLDGSAAGDMNGDGLVEIALVVRNGTYSTSVLDPQNGTIVVVDGKGNPVFEHTLTTSLVGFPAMADFDGDGLDEVAICENDNSGHCRVYDFDGTELFSMGPLNSPGMTNSGPTAADLNNDGYMDLIALDFSGKIAVSFGPTGSQSWIYDAGDLHGELFFGSSIATDVDDDGQVEVVAVGYNSGALYVLNGLSGALESSLTSVYDTYETVPWGSGPLAVNLDNDDDLEIVSMQWGAPATSHNGVNYPGTDHALVAYEPSGAILWHKSVAGAEFEYISAVATDTDGNGEVEIFAQGANGVLYRFDTNGDSLGTSNVGTESWSAPSFVDVDVDGEPEVITQSDSTVNIYRSGSFSSPAFSYSSPAATMYPPAIQMDLDGDSEVELLFGAWFPKKIISLDLDVLRTLNWATQQGHNDRNGVAALDPNSIIDGDPAPVIGAVLDRTLVLIGTEGRRVRRELEDAHEYLELGLERYLQGYPHATNAFGGGGRDNGGLYFIEKAIQEYNDAIGDGLDIDDDFQPLVTQLMYVLTKQYYDRTVINVGTSPSNISSAKTYLDRCKAHIAREEWESAASDCEESGYKVRYHLDYAGGAYTGNYCPTIPDEQFLVWACLVHEAKDQIQTWKNANQGGSNMTNANNYMYNGLTWLPDNVFDRAFSYFQSAAYYLDRISNPDVSTVFAKLSYSLSNATRLQIRNVRAYVGNSANVQSAEAQWDYGETDRLAGEHYKAIQHYKNAVDTVKP